MERISRQDHANCTIVFLQDFLQDTLQDLQSENIRVVIVVSKDFLNLKYLNTTNSRFALTFHCHIKNDLAQRQFFCPESLSFLKSLLLEYFLFFVKVPLSIIKGTPFKCCFFQEMSPQ